jgi:sortase (surface protein transpeptidase)
MKVNLPLVSSLLRQEFSESRLMLLGEVAVASVVATPTPVVVPTLPIRLATSSAKTAKVVKKTQASFTLHPVLRRALQVGLTSIILVSFAVAAILFIPQVYYRVFPADTQPIETTDTGTPIGGAFDTGAELKPEVKVELPPQDKTLPEGTWVVIPRIGVRTQLDSSLTADEALAKGVWMAPDYGVPGDKTKPVILAAHRYGWKWWWKSDYWKYHSFYLLPELQPGDIVEIIHDQRKYYYEIYAGEEGEAITDYSADMILYTCKYLSSPLRHFRYARLVDMNKDTQKG